MRYFENESFYYKDNKLYCEEIAVEDIVKETGTPAFIYSKKFFTERYKRFTEAFKEIDHTVFYAAKSNYNLNVMKIFAGMGSGIDVNSLGELHRALKTGIDPEKIILTGVGKTEEEIKAGLEKGVLLIKAESVEEVELINEIAGEMGKKAPLAIRVNPDVDAETLPYISTGLAENKFGIDVETSFGLFKKAAQMPNIDLKGIDMHIGSQITKTTPFVEAVKRMNELIKKLKSEGIELEHLDIGGGYGITYLDETPFSPEELAKELVPLFKETGLHIMFEPGRFMTANGGILATRVVYTKQNKIKNFLVVDSSMAELLRPSIYGAYHHIQPLNKSEEKDVKADVVGPVCESGDFLGKAREISPAKRNDLLAVMSAGAYGMVMSSNYNGRRRPPEIIVDGNKYYTARGRETYEHLLFDETIVKELH